MTCCSGEDEADACARASVLRERHARLAKDLTDKYLNNELDQANNNKEEENNSAAANAVMEKMVEKEVRGRCKEEIRELKDMIRELLRKNS